MLIKNDFEVAQSVEKVWRFFDDIPQVAACLPGAELTEDLGNDNYKGKVAVRMGPVKLQFAGTAAIKERDEAGKRIVVDAAGADEKGRGQAAMLLTAKLAPVGGGTKIEVAQDLQPLGGRRAVRPGDDLGRHHRPDAGLRHQHAEPHQRHRPRGGVRPDRHGRAGQRLRHRRPGGVDGPQAGGPPLLPGPTSPTRAEEETMVLWWIGNAILLLVVVPVLVALLNRVLAASSASAVPRTTSWPAA